MIDNPNKLGVQANICHSYEVIGLAAQRAQQMKEYQRAHPLLRFGMLPGYGGEKLSPRNAKTVQPGDRHLR